jgi:hypothetical protein
MVLPKSRAPVPVLPRPRDDHAVGRAEFATDVEAVQAAAVPNHLCKGEDGGRETRDGARGRESVAPAALALAEPPPAVAMKGVKP